jgi:putative transposase
MRELGIQSVIRKKRPFYGRRGSVVFPNVLNREFCADHPFQKLVTDITYVRVEDTFAYLSAVLDLYNNEIVAWELSERNNLKLVLNTLKQLERKLFSKNALLHSDQGFQYTTKSYENQLQELQIQGSHSRRGNCHDHACIESFFSHLKTEKLYLVRPKTIEQAYQAVEEYIHFCNHIRFQEKLNGLSSVEYRAKTELNILFFQCLLDRVMCNPRPLFFVCLLRLFGLVLLHLLSWFVIPSLTIRFLTPFSPAVNSLNILGYHGESSTFALWVSSNFST